MNTKQLLTQILSQLETISQNYMSPTISPEIIAAILAALVTIITLIFNKYKERELQQRNIKIERYTSFLSALISLKSGLDTSKELSETLQVLSLIGSNEVVIATSKFIDLLADKKDTYANVPKANKEAPPTTDNSDDLSNQKEIQDTLYSNLIQAMRNDLYGKKSTKNFPKQLSLTIFQSASSDPVNELANSLLDIVKKNQP